MSARPTRAVLALALAQAVPAVAQNANAEQCSGTSSPAEEIACLRRALAKSQAQAGTRDRPAAQTQPSPAAAPAGLGAEQVAVSHPASRAAEPSRPQMTAIATPVAADHLGLITLRLENGQLWRQTESGGTPLRLADGRPYPVEIAASGFGGYRMRFPEIGRQIVVKRLR